MRRRLPLGTFLLLAMILVLALHIEGCGKQHGGSWNGLGDSGPISTKTTMTGIATGGMGTVESKRKHMLFHQRMARRERRRMGLDENEFFFGLINKAMYRREVG